MWVSFTLWLHQLQLLLVKAWNNQTPMQYGGMLVCISVVGWLMMKGGAGTHETPRELVSVERRGLDWP